MNDIVKLGIDTYHGTVEKYSVKEANDTLREALIAANNGSTKMDYRAIRDGKCNGLFTIIENILANTVVEGLQGDEFFMNHVEFRNTNEGDENLFLVEDNNMFIVDDVADGTQGIRRQRLGGLREVSIPTSMKAIRIYDELNRVLSGRVDFNKMINYVGDAYRRKMLEDIYSLWVKATTPAAVTGGADMGSATYFPAAGTWNEDKLLELIDHVEAATGKPATIVGTRTALRNAKESIMSDGAKDELHRMGYFGTFYGTPCVALPQRHKIGSESFILNDKVINVIAGDEKPIKFVWEGNPLIVPDKHLDNADLTYELDILIIY